LNGALQLILDDWRGLAAIRRGIVGSVQKVIRELRELDDGTDFDEQVDVHFLEAALCTRLRRKAADDVLRRGA
jgi:hypothetical protein